MNEESGYLSIGTEKLHYLQWGNGRRLLLAFHGYGNDATIFAPIAEYLSKEYTMLSFDLPHHGESKWTEDTKLTRKDLYDLVKTVRVKYNVEKLSLLGNSMGGRVCLSILESVPQHIDKVALIATDGLTINFYYYFLTRTWFGKKVFRTMMEKPELFFGVVNWLKKMNLVNAGRHRFVMNFLQTDASRKFLLQVWPAMSDLIPSPANLKRLIGQYAIHLSIFLGAYDKIILPSLGKRFKSGLSTVQLHILEKGHLVLDHENAQQIAESLL